MSQKVWIIGAKGRVGHRLFSAMQDCDGLTPLAEDATDPLLAVVLAVPDDCIAEVGTSARHVTKAPILHCAGSLGPAAFGALGGDIGVMHPLASFVGAKGLPSLTNVTFLIDGSQRAIASAVKITEALGARPVITPSHGGTYHGVAAMVANGGAALCSAAIKALDDIDWGKQDSRNAIASLLRSVADNVEAVGFPQALSGPIQRGNLETVASHQRALEQDSPSTLETYNALIPSIVACAKDAGLSDEEAQRFLALTRESDALP